MELLERRQLLATDPLAIGGKSFDAAYHVATDTAGNRIVAGIFSGTVDFDPSSGSSKLTAKGETDLYIAKFSSTNQLIWVRQYGGAAGEIQEKHLYDISQATVGEFQNKASPTFEGTGEYVNALAIGADNSIVFGGSFQGTMDFNPLSDSKGNVKSAGYQDGFVCKVDSSGNTVWYATIAGPFNDVVKGVAIDSKGDVAVTGYFTRYADFNPSNKTYRIDAIGRDDVFVEKLIGSTGGLDWAVSTGGDSVDSQERDAGEAIAIDSSNNLLITGSFAGEADFAPGKGTFYVKAVKQSDGFIWQLSSKGKFARVQTFGGKSWDSGNKIAVDSNNNAYIAGYFSRTADLDPTKAVQNFEYTDENDFRGTKTDMFVLKINPSGSTQWITQLKGAGYEWLGDLNLQGTAGVAVTGGFAGQLQIGASAALVSVRGEDKFRDDKRRKYSYDAFYTVLSQGKGKMDKLTSYGAASDDYGIGFSDSSLLVGRFKGTVNFGTTADPFNRKSNGQDDGFLLDLI